MVGTTSRKREFDISEHYEGQNKKTKVDNHEKNEDDHEKPHESTEPVISCSDGDHYLENLPHRPNHFIISYFLDGYTITISNYDVSFCNPHEMITCFDYEQIPDADDDLLDFMFENNMITDDYHCLLKIEKFRSRKADCIYEEPLCSHSVILNATQKVFSHLTKRKIQEHEEKHGCGLGHEEQWSQYNGRSRVLNIVEENMSNILCFIYEPLYLDFKQNAVQFLFIQHFFKNPFKLSVKSLLVNLRSNVYKNSAELVEHQKKTDEVLQNLLKYDESLQTVELVPFTEFEEDKIMDFEDFDNNFMEERNEEDAVSIVPQTEKIENEEKSDIDSGKEDDDIKSKLLSFFSILSKMNEDELRVKYEDASSNVKDAFDSFYAALQSKTVAHAYPFDPFKFYYKDSATESETDGKESNFSTNECSANTDLSGMTTCKDYSRLHRTSKYFNSFGMNI